MQDIINTQRRDELEQMEGVANTQNRMVIFSDYGLDDAVATAYVLANRVDFAHIDILPIGGNVTATAALHNIRKLLAAAFDDGLDLRGVRIVDSTDYYQECCPLADVHGADGMGDLFAPCEKSPVPECAFEPWADEIGAGYRVLSLGPCTMVKRALVTTKNMPGGRIVIMGGCTRETPNFGKYEFNDGLDHSAFLWTLRRPHVAVTLDTCRMPAFNLAGTRKSGGRLFDTLVNRSVELAEARHGDNSYIYDYIAAVALIRPELFETNEVFMPEIFRPMYELRLRAAYRDRKDLL